MEEEDSFYNYSEGNATYNATPIEVHPATLATGAEAHTVSGGSSSGRRAPFQRFGNSQTAVVAAQPQPGPTPTPPTARTTAHGGARNPRRSSEERGLRATSAAVPSSPLHGENLGDGERMTRGGGGGGGNNSFPPLEPAAGVAACATAPSHPHPRPIASAGAALLASPSSADGVRTRSRSGRASTSETPSRVAAASAEVNRQAARANTNIITPATLTQLRTHIAHSHGLAGSPIVMVAPATTTTTGHSAARGAHRSTGEGLDDNDTTQGPEEDFLNGGGESGRPKPRPPQLRPVVVAQSAIVERLGVTGNGGNNNSNNNSANTAAGEHNALGRSASMDGSSKKSPHAYSSADAGGRVTAVTARLPSSPAGGVVIPMLEPIRTEVSESLSPSLFESAAGLEGDLAPEVAEACHGFLRHLPVPWARSVVRATTLQAATLLIPPRLLRAPALFDTYAELRGEVAAALEAATTAAAKLARATTATPAATVRGSRGSNAGGGGGGARPAAPSSPSAVGRTDFSSPLFHTIDVQHLLTVAPALLRHRLHNTRAGKVDELRAGFRANAQTAARTEASVNRYAYLPHVQRDVHYGAVLAQGVLRWMLPGPWLSDGMQGQQQQQQHGSPGKPTSSSSNTSSKNNNNNNSNAVESSHGSPRSHGQHATATTNSALSQPTPLVAAVPALARTYTAVTFENFPSIFLKDRFDVAQTERLGGSSSGANYRQSARRRRRIVPLFERDFVATIASGQEEAALFASTLAPEFMVGLPSFLKHPERAVPLCLTASLHHLYSALTFELFMRAYTTAAVAKAAAEEAAAAAAAAAVVTVRGGQEAAAATVPTRGNLATVLSLTPSEATPTPSLTLRGPSLELGMLYVRNTIVCSASTPGMEAYLIFLHQIVYPPRDGVTPSSSSCRAVVQLSEDAQGSMAAPPAPPRSGGPLPGTFEMPAMKHAAVEMTQLVSWVQDLRSHDARHGQPFSCHLAFVPTYIADIAVPTPSQLCSPLPQTTVTDDANAYPCAVVMATVDLWRTLSPAEVSNLLRIFFVLDRHAQRVMELESPDYGTDAEAAAAVAAAATAAAAKTRDGTEETEDVDETANNPVAHAIAFPDPRVRQHVAKAVEEQVRVYVESVSALRGGSPSLQQRLVSYFMARLRYYEDLNVRHCKTEEELQREELERMAERRHAHQPSTTPEAADHNHRNNNNNNATGANVPSSAASSSSFDVYEVRGKSLGDALAVALAAEAVAVASAGNVHHTNSSNRGQQQQQQRCSQSPSADSRAGTSQLGEDGVVTAPSVVILLVPQRDVQRR